MKIISLIAFTVLMCAAAAITAHGTWVFYSYILDGWLPVLATVVLTVGIPFLELAAVLDRDNRVRYVGGMLFLLFMEGMAQYWQGQAVFVPRVLESFGMTSRADLVWFAQHPAGRLLPIVYLAALSGIVVYFGYAASIQVRDLLAETHDAAPVLSFALPAQPVYDTPVQVTELLPSNTSNTPINDRTCRHCGTNGLTQVELMAHGRSQKKHGHCPEA